MEASTQKAVTINSSYLLNSATCNTQVYIDREVEVILCQEDRQCEFRRSYNSLQICTNPTVAS